MRVLVEPTRLPGAAIVRNEAYQDDRGWFQEVFRSDEFGRAGLPESFVQLNHSRSMRGVVRGLHFQWHPAMGKLMRVTRGRAFLVAVDIRKGSSTLGQWLGMELKAESHTQIWAPAGFARGFCALSSPTEIEYLCTGVYSSEGESGIRWNDPEIGISWPVADPDLSERDANAQTLREWLETPESDYLTMRGAQ